MISPHDEDAMVDDTNARPDATMPMQPRSLVSSIALGHIPAANGTTYESPNQAHNASMAQQEKHAVTVGAGASAWDEPTAAGNQEQQLTEDTTWKDFINFDIPDYTKVNLKDVAQLRDLYTAYQATYLDHDTTNSVRMKYAQALAFALLTHYYPASQGYTIQTGCDGPVTRNGMSFILKTARGDPSHTINPKGRKKPGPSPEQWRYIMNTQWRWIEPEDIATFVVLTQFEVMDDMTGKVTYRQHPHTYLTIMIDIFDELPRFSEANFLHRSDVLSDALCRNAKVEDGYGILLYGPRMEFYRYNAGKEWEHFEDDPGDSEDEVQDVEPIMAPILEAGVGDVAIDMRNSDLSAVDKVFKGKIIPCNVTYMDHVVGTRAITPASDLAQTPK